MCHICVYVCISLLLECIPAGVSLATTSVDTLGQGVMQSGINHIQTDWFLMHLTARVPVNHTHTHTNNQNGEGLLNIFLDKIPPNSKMKHDHICKYSKFNLKRNQSTICPKMVFIVLVYAKQLKKDKLLDTKHRGKSDSEE